MALEYTIYQKDEKIPHSINNLEDPQIIRLHIRQEFIRLNNMLLPWEEAANVRRNRNFSLLSDPFNSTACV